MLKAEVGELAYLTEARLVVQFDENIVDWFLDIIFQLICSEIFDDVLFLIITQFHEEHFLDPLLFFFEDCFFLCLYLSDHILERLQKFCFNLSYVRPRDQLHHPF